MPAWSRSSFYPFRIPFIPQFLIFQRLSDLFGVVGLSVSDVQYDGLNRRQPDREATGKMLDQHTEEPLQGTEQRPVDHDRLMFPAVFANIVYLKAFRQVEIHLDGGALPGTAQDVLNFYIDFRPVKSPVSFIQDVWLAVGF